MLKLFQKVVIVFQPRSLGSSLSVACTHYLTDYSSHWRTSVGLGVGCPVSSLYTGQQLQRRTDMRWEQVPTCPSRRCTGSIQMSKWGGWMTQELGRDTPAWLLPVPEWWVSLCHVTRGQSRTSRLSRVNSHTSALVDVEIWVHMETKEDNDRMKSCSDVCVCVCVCVLCT